MEDILYKRLSDETIVRISKCTNLWGQILVKKFMKLVSKKNSSTEVITQTDKNGSIFFSCFKMTLKNISQAKLTILKMNKFGELR